VMMNQLKLTSMFRVSAPLLPSLDHNDIVAAFPEFKTVKNILWQYFSAKPPTEKIVSRTVTGPPNKAGDTTRSHLCRRTGSAFNKNLNNFIVILHTVSVQDKS
jgi:hypothetical protein